MNRNMQKALAATRECLKRAQTRAQHYADQHRREEQFQIGDKVLLSTRNLKFRGKKANKFMPKFIGPFEIISKVGSVAYKLKLPISFRMFHTFHVSLLRRHYTDSRRNTVTSEPEEIEEETFVKVKKILDHQDKKKPGTAKNKIRRYFYIRWEGLPPSEDS